MESFYSKLESHNVWLWGCKSDIIPFIIRIITNCNGNIKGFIDNDKSCHNKKVHGYPVFSPDSFIANYKKDDLLLICSFTSKGKKIISEQLDNLGINQYFHLDCLEDCLFKIPKLNSSFIDRADEPRIISKCCNSCDFQQPWFKEIMRNLKRPLFRFHRKDWEFCYIIKVLEDNNLLQKGKTGIGFAVGLEPLSSYFASKGCNILATDLFEDVDNVAIWGHSGQNACGNVEKLFKDYLVSKDLFYKNVTYKNLDMNKIPNDIGTFDFCWSSCAIEHVGSLSLSKLFLKNMINVLKPGGIAVHTTEFNLSSNDDTITEGGSIVYRRKDLEELKEWFNANGCEMRVSFKRGFGDRDLFLPFPPYESNDKRDHLNLFIDKYICTSFALIIKKLH